MSSYSKTISEGKEEARDILFKEVKRLIGTRRKFKCLSMPASNFELEKRIRGFSRRAEIDTVECKATVYGKGVKKARKLNINHNHGDIFQYLYTNPEKQYDFIWLDMCGPIKPWLINRLLPVFQGFHTTNKAVIGLTTMRQREVFKHKRIYGIQTRTFGTWRTLGLYKILSFFAQQTGCKLTYTVFEYVSGNGRAMQLMTFILKKPINSIIN